MFQKRSCFWMGIVSFSTLLLSGCQGGGSDIKPMTSLDHSILVIGHRGASALRPEHTIASYTQAILDGADVIEPDLVSTQDGYLVARHENEISGTTNVADHPEFASRKTTKTIDGQSVTGWFTEDFTLKELKTLRAKERIPQNRPSNTQYNGQFEIPTLQEVIDLAKTMGPQVGRTIAIYPETKHPTYFKSIDLPLEKRLVDQLHQNGYVDKSAPVFIQSFEVGNLKEMRTMTKLKLVQLMQIGTTEPQPYDYVAAKNPTTYADMATAAGMKAIATYADGVGPNKNAVIPVEADGKLGHPTSLVQNAHAAGLIVHPWTFRPENPFLPPALRQGDVKSATEHGDLQAEFRAFFNAGVDGVFSDDPGAARRAVTAYSKH